MARILLIGDDEPVCDAIAEMLERENLGPVLARDLQSGLEKACTMRPELVLLDLQRPGAANFEMCRQLRASQVLAPMIVLSAIGHEVDKVLMLEIGADDYIVKPFNLRELLARIRAMLRRASKNTQTVKFADIDVDLTRRIVSKRAEEVSLTRSEYNLLAYFLLHPDRVVTRDMILHSVWGYDSYPNTRTVDVHVVRLRQKLEPDRGGVGHFRTVHGVGYRFVPHE